jgi:hypothetical protein
VVEGVGEGVEEVVWTEVLLDSASGDRAGFFCQIADQGKSRGFSSTGAVHLV